MSMKTQNMLLAGVILILVILSGNSLIALAQSGLLPPIPARFDLVGYDIDPQVVAAFQIYPEASICAAYDGIAAAQGWLDFEWERLGIRTEQLDIRSLVEEHIREAPTLDAMYYIQIRAELQGITRDSDPIFYQKLAYLRNAAR